MSYKGKYKIKNPDKYVGNENNITYRSLWELKVMKYLDSSDKVIKWSSEPFPIQYFNPLKQKTSNYWPDFLVEFSENGVNKTVLIEVKPQCQTTKPKQPKKLTKKSDKRYRRNLAIWAVNSNKWKNAKMLCESRGWEFRILTEKHIQPKEIQ